MNEETHLDKVRGELAEQRANSPIDNFGVGDMAEAMKTDPPYLTMGKKYKIEQVDTRNCVLQITGDHGGIVLMYPEAFHKPTT